MDSGVRLFVSVLATYFLHILYPRRIAHVHITPTASVSFVCVEVCHQDIAHQEGQRLDALHQMD